MLEVHNLTVRYGKHLALDDVSFSIKQRQSVVLLGANGAGKSSLLKAMTGIVLPAAGRVTLNGVELDLKKSHEVIDHGLAIVPEGRGIFGGLSVFENLKLGANPKHARASEKKQFDYVCSLFPRLAERQTQLAGTMSGGEQQMVAIGRALMSNPQYLLLDEPSLGLAPIVVKELFAALEQIRQTGLSILLVEQNVREGLNLADHGYLLEAGRITGHGKTSDLKNDDAVQRAFLGASLS
jgi:branched-chain amino acid transport system ATP-binding protein